MKITTRLLILAFICLAISCTRSKPSKTIAVVLCDVSNSVTRKKSITGKQGNLEMLKQYAQAIPGNFRSPAAIYYLPVSAHMNEKLLSEKPLKLIKDNDVKRMKQDKENKIILSEIISDLDTLAINAPSSCLLSSIEHACKILKEKSEADPSAELVLIIVSDMLETCKGSPLGNFSIDPGDITNEAQRKKQVESFKPNVNFSEQAVTVYVLNTATWTTRKESEMITGLWKDLFTRMNYTKPVDFYTTIPECFNPLQEKEKNNKLSEKN